MIVLELGFSKQDYHKIIKREYLENRAGNASGIMRVVSSRKYT